MSIRSARTHTVAGALAVLVAILLTFSITADARAAVPAGEVNPVTASGSVKTNAKAFQTPSGRVACAYETSYETKKPVLFCERRLKASDTDKPKVQGASKGSCELDWGGVAELHPTGKAKVACVGSVMVPQRAPRKLAYGTKWARGNFICLSREDALRCSTKNGAHGFKMNRSLLRVW